LVLLLLISFVGAVGSTTCSSFPKIFGGTTKNTFLHYIDAYNDYLALSGNTFDTSLTGISSSSAIPFLAMASISTGGKYYWAKVLSLKLGDFFRGV
jgi:hypothetical protein